MEKMISPVSLSVISRSPSLYFRALLIRLPKRREQALRLSVRRTFSSGSVIRGVISLCLRTA